MQRNDIDQDVEDERDESDGAVETEEHPAPGVEYKPEPDAENIMPAKDRPGTSRDD
jgi:hypothetical protein